ncbi:MAG: RDD family protein [Planctomycetes bacterium]|nr:RDD family protein [Planctomycetota bacterium]
MPQPPKPPAVSPFYERKRKLAYHFAWLSMTFLLIQLFLGSLLEFVSHPRATVSESGVCLLHRCLTQDDADGSRLLILDAAMKAPEGSLRLLDTATAVLPEGREITVFHGARVSLMTDRRVTRNSDLGQKWDVLGAVPDPGRAGAWLFGCNEGMIVARRRENGKWGAEIPIVKSGLVDRLSASMDGSAGPLVAWRERGSPLVRSAVFDGAAFAPRPDFSVGAVQHWDTALSRGRVLLATYDRDDRSFKYVTLRLECCAGCPAPVAQRKIAFSDAVLLLGRKVTGLAAALTGDRLRFFVTRTTTVMTGSIPLETLQAEPAARLISIAVDPLWRNIAGAVAPTLLFFFSCSLVFLGLTLLRERGRIASEKADSPPPPGPPVAGILPRAMAYVLDLVLLFPAFLAAAGLLAVSLDDMDDPHYLTLMAVIAGVEMAYHFVMEWALGWTLGKKILGLRVTEMNGSRLTFRGALIRNLARLLDAQVPFGMILGLALMIKTKRRQRLGDVAGRTMVIQE